MESPKTKTKLNLILFSILFSALLTLISGCRTGSDKPLQTAEISAPLPAASWLLQPVIYQFRHSAKLEYQNKEEFFEGFMELDLKQNQAHLVIFTALGVTLLNLEIKPHSFAFAGNSSHSKQEQGFAAAVTGAVQKIFFSLIDYNTPNSQLTVNLHKTSGSAELSQISAKQSNPDWIVSYANYRDYPCGRLPQRILLQNRRPEFKLTLWLHKAEIKK